MLLNTHTAISTNSVLLVPYESHHVPEYHEWMQRPELQELTASELLTLEEEYGMQKSWRQDNDKLTFIICEPLSSSSPHAKSGVHDVPNVMVGDINLFLSSNPDSTSATSMQDVGVVGEVEVMIAKPGARGEGRGRASVLAFLAYVMRHEAEVVGSFAGGGKARGSFDYLRVKIGKGNRASIGLFEGLGFEKVPVEGSENGENVFGEVELRLGVGLETAMRAWAAKWPEALDQWREIQYSRPAGDDGMSAGSTTNEEQNDEGEDEDDEMEE